LVRRRATGGEVCRGAGAILDLDVDCDDPATVDNLDEQVLVPSGTYLSVCFSEEDSGFGGTGEFRTTSIGTVLYFSSEDELRDLFEPYFEITTLKTIQVEGKREPHMMNYAFMEKMPT
jgi:hypothetical protein